MTRTILPDFVKFQAEANIVGRLLAGYTGLELALMNCVQMVRNDFDATLKMMFRIRSESQRLSLADALARNDYHDLNLGTQFEMMMADFRHCLKIRNQYAHCVWWRLSKTRHSVRAGCFFARAGSRRRRLGVR